MTTPDRPRTSRQRYDAFVRDYRAGRLDQVADEAEQRKLVAPGSSGASASTEKKKGARRKYIREYLRWLKPQRAAVAVLFVLALGGAGMQMVEPLFMRFIVDKVLLAP